MKEDPHKSKCIPFGSLVSGCCQKPVLNAYTIIVMYLPVNAGGEFSGFETTPGHSGHFCTILQADVKSEIKTSRFGSAFGDFQSGM